MPEPPVSVPLKLTTTSCFVQVPWPYTVLPLLVAEADATGFVASRLTVTDSLSLPPALVAEHVKVTPDVSEVTLLEPHPVLRR